MSQTSFDWDVQEQEEDDSGTGIIKGPVNIIVNNNISGGGSGTGTGTAAIPEPAADGKLYGRVRQEGETDGAWGVIPDPVGIESPVNIDYAGSLDSPDDLPPDGTGGAWIINGHLWVWDPEAGEWRDQGPFRGEKGDPGEPGPPGEPGAPGKDGKGLDTNGSLTSEGELPETGQPGDVWIINGHLWVWNPVLGQWEDQGLLQGAPGEPGAPGKDAIGIPDAPEDGKQYARKNGEWAEVAAAGGGGMPEAVAGAFSPSWLYAANLY